MAEPTAPIPRQSEPRREAAIIVRIDNMDTLASEGQMAIRIPLTEVGPETIAEWVASALREVPDPIHWGEKWSAH